MSRRYSTSARQRDFPDRRLPFDDRKNGDPGTSMRKLERKVDNLSEAVRTLHERVNDKSKGKRPEDSNPQVPRERQDARAPGELRDYLNKKNSMGQTATRKGLKRLWKTVFGPKAGDPTQPQEREDPLCSQAGGRRRRASARMKTQGPSGENEPEKTFPGREGPAGPPTLTSILRQIREEEFLRWPKALKNLEGGDQWEYCHYHCCNGHDTEDCRQLRNEVERLRMEGYLHRFL